MALRRRLRTLLTGLSLAALTAGAAQAQNAGADRRLDRIERDLKTVQSIVLQAQATGQPVVVRPEGADPAVTALQSRVDDLEMTLQRINGEIETVARDVGQARRDATAAEEARRGEMRALTERLARLESMVAAYTGAADASDPSLAPSPLLSGNPASDATARAQAQDTGVLGGGARPPPPPPPPPAAQTPAQAFAAARDLFTSGQHAAAADAFQDFISRNPNNARTAEAYYWLGESFYAQRGYQNATAAYASALRDRPTTNWAPQAMVRLAQSLTQSGQGSQACAALAEFDRRYAARANANLKSNADAVRKRAACS